MSCLVLRNISGLGLVVDRLQNRLWWRRSLDQLDHLSNIALLRVRLLITKKKKKN